MKVKDAVNIAVRHISVLFEQEELTNLGLEEVEFDTDMNEWVVTVGFSRPWDYPKTGLATIATSGGRPNRSFKIVRIHDETGDILAIKNRATSD